MSGFHSLSLPLARQLGGHLRNAIVFADVLRPKYRAFDTNNAFRLLQHFSHWRENQVEGKTRECRR